MKKIFFVLTLFLAACGSTGFEPAAAAYESPQPSVTAVPTATATLEPTPTVGYQATALAAQQTLDATNRLMVEATSEYERRQFELTAFTAEAERQQMWIYEETATAAATAIPATQTQAAMLAIAIGTQQSIMIMSQMMTQQAPTMIVALANAQSQAEFANTEAVVRIFLLFALGCFLLGVGLWAFRESPAREVEQPAEPLDLPGVDDQPIIPIDLGTVVTIRQDQGGGYMTDAIKTVPCTPEQLTELAEGLISGQKTLAFKYWEGSGSKLKRDVYLPVRHFLQVNKYAIGAGVGSGSLVLTDAGKAFFRGWLDLATLPPSYEFTHMTGESTGKSAHEHENHGHDHAVGEPNSADFGIAVA